MWFIFNYYWESTSHPVVLAFSSHLSSFCCSSFLPSPLALLLKMHLLHKSKESGGGCRVITMSMQQFPTGASELIKSSNLRCVCQYITLCTAVFPCGRNVHEHTTYADLNIQKYQSQNIFTYIIFTRLSSGLIYFLFLPISFYLAQKCPVNT